MPLCQVYSSAKNEARPLLAWMGAARLQVVIPAMPLLTRLLCIPAYVALSWHSRKLPRPIAGPLTVTSAPEAEPNPWAKVIDA